MIAQPTVDIREEIAAANAEFMAAANRGDAAALAALYSHEAMLMPPNNDFFTGRDAIQAFWQAVANSGVTGCKLETVEAELCGETAIEVGRFHLYIPGGVEADHGKYIVIWKQEEGHWRLHRDIFNSSKPA